jgi:NADP-dependent 3-hydroxy acid dehydrogenase YdfG
MTNLEGRWALVTGASAGIGEATARALSEAGARVVLAARRLDRLQALEGELACAQALALDVRDAGAVAAALQERRFDIVVANAGLARGTGTIPEGDPADWQEVLDTNVRGVLNVLRYTLPAMIEAGSGHVVLLGSVAGRQVYPGGNVYCASKFAVRAIYEGLRVDALGSGVRFTTVDPGLVETEFSTVRFRGDEERARAVYQGMQPLTGADVADAILWAVTRPPHVDVGELVLWPTAQASTTSVHRTQD